MTAGRCFERGREVGVRYAWLKSTLEKMTAGHPQSKVHELLPWNLDPESSRKSRCGARTACFQTVKRTVEAGVFDDWLADLCPDMGELRSDTAERRGDTYRPCAALRKEPARLSERED